MEMVMRESNTNNKTSDFDQEMDGQDGTPNSGLLSEKNNSNGEEAAKRDEAEDQSTKSQKVCIFSKERTTKKTIAVFFLFVFLIAIVIIVSVFWCIEFSDDDDEKYDKSQFQLEQKFNGSFQMPYMFSNETQGPDDVQQKLADLYESSPALGRFFKAASTSRLRPDSSVVQYKLTFVFPEEQQTELRNFTLSWEMVYNVFRQFLYDQDKDQSGIMFIDPGSLKMDTMQ